MKVAVKDANVLIDLVEGDLLGRRQAGQDILEIGVSGRSKPVTLRWVSRWVRWVRQEPQTSALNQI
jgi:hypothetical protein